MALLLKGGRLLDPSGKTDRIGCLLINNGKIAGSGIEPPSVGTPGKCHAG